MAYEWTPNKAQSTPLPPPVPAPPVPDEPVSRVAPTPTVQTRPSGPLPVETPADGVEPPQQGTGRIVSAYATDMALDWQKIRFALELGVLWAIGATFCLFLSNSLDSGFFLAGSLALLWTASCLQWLVGGVGRMVAMELQGERHSRQDAWSFVRAHPLGLVFGTWLVLFATAILMALVSLLVRVLAGIPAVGPTLGALLVVPVFLLILAGLSVVANSYMMPCIMGVENANVHRAVGYLIRFAKKPFQALRSLQEYVEVLTSFLPVALFTGVFVLGGLVASLLVCTGDFRALLVPKDSLSGLVQGFAVGFVFYSWIAYIAVYLACSVSMIYYNSSR